MNTGKQPSAVRALYLLCLSVVLGCGWPTSSEAVLIVSPGAQAELEGNTRNSFPFNFSMRYQQVFSNSDFAALSPGLDLITQLKFRPDAVNGNPFSSTLPNVQINLSTTLAAPDALSVTFADNVGADDTIVFSGPLALSSADTGPAGGPKDFDITINLTTPFTYNPASGNLLMDVRVFSAVFTTIFDADTSVSHVFSRDLNAPVGTRDNFGLVTQFNVVPEPSTAFVGMMLVLFTAVSRHRRVASASRE